MGQQKIQTQGNMIDIKKQPDKNGKLAGVSSEINPENFL